MRLEVPHPTRAAVESFAQSLGVTPFAVTAAALGRLLARLSGAPDVVLRMSYANRERREFESLVSCTRIGVGLVVRAPMRVPFTTLVKQTCAASLAALDNPVSIDRVVYELCATGRGAEPDRPLIGFAFQNLPGPEVAFTGLATRVENVAAAASRADLTFGLVSADAPARGYQAWLEYTTDLWEPATATRLLREYVDSLAELCDPARVA